MTSGSREAAAERLRELGYRVLEAADGAAALRLMDDGDAARHAGHRCGAAERHEWAAGRRGAARAAARHPLLFITGYAGTEFPPGSEVIDKPFDLDTLARKVQAVLSDP